MENHMFVVSAKAFIVSTSGQVLFLERSADSKNNPHRLDLPGGKIDEITADTIGETLMREIDEEIGTQRPELQQTERPDDLYFFERGGRQFLRIIRFLESPDPFVPHVLSDEHLTYAWVDIADIMKEPERFVPSQLEQIKTFVRSFGK